MCKSLIIEIEWTDKNGEQTEYYEIENFQEIYDFHKKYPECWNGELNLDWLSTDDTDESKKYCFCQQEAIVKEFASRLPNIIFKRYGYKVTVSYL